MTNEEGSDRTVVVFDLLGPSTPVPIFEEEIYEAGQLVSSDGRQVIKLTDLKKKRTCYFFVYPRRMWTRKPALYRLT